MRRAWAAFSFRGQAHGSTGSADQALAAGPLPREQLPQGGAPSPADSGTSVLLHPAAFRGVEREGWFPLLEVDDADVAPPTGGGIEIKLDHGDAGSHQLTSKGFVVGLAQALRPIFV